MLHVACMRCWPKIFASLWFGLDWAGLGCVVGLLCFFLSFFRSEYEDFFFIYWTLWLTQVSCWTFSSKDWISYHHHHTLLSNVFHSPSSIHHPTHITPFHLTGPKVPTNPLGYSTYFIGWCIYNL